MHAQHILDHAAHQLQRQRCKHCTICQHWLLCLGIQQLLQAGGRLCKGSHSGLQLLKTRGQAFQRGCLLLQQLGCCCLLQVRARPQQAQGQSRQVGLCEGGVGEGCRVASALARCALHVKTQRMHVKHGECWS